jgi:hypothetical protein
MKSSPCAVHDPNHEFSNSTFKAQLVRDLPIKMLSGPLGGPAAMLGALNWRR